MSAIEAAGRQPLARGLWVLYCTFSLAELRESVRAAQARIPGS